MSALVAPHIEDDPFNFAKYADPYPNYRRVREATPVYWSELLGSWVLTRYADVKAALLDQRLSAAHTREAQAAQLSEDLRRELAPVDELLGRWVLFQDNPAHRRIRQALSAAFNARVIEQLRPRIQKRADDLIDAARGRGEMDLVADFALQLPAIVIAELLGMPGTEYQRFQDWVHTIALYFTSPLDMVRISASERCSAGWKARSRSARFCAAWAISSSPTTRQSGGQPSGSVLWQHCRSHSRP